LSNARNSPPRLDLVLFGKVECFAFQLSLIGNHL